MLEFSSMFWDILDLFIWNSNLMGYPLVCLDDPTHRWQGSKVCSKHHQSSWLLAGLFTTGYTWWERPVDNLLSYSSSRGENRLCLAHWEFPCQLLGLVWHGSSKLGFYHTLTSNSRLQWQTGKEVTKFPKSPPATQFLSGDLFINKTLAHLWTTMRTG
jgi:hypothetical protein